MSKSRVCPYCGFEVSSIHPIETCRINRIQGENVWRSVREGEDTQTREGHSSILKKECLVCEQVFFYWNKKRVYCSNRCRKKAATIKKGIKSVLSKQIVFLSPDGLPLCLSCQKPFQRTKIGHKYCSHYCRNKASYTRNRDHVNALRRQKKATKNLPPLIEETVVNHPVINTPIEDTTEQIRETIPNYTVETPKEEPTPLIVKHNESNVPLTHDEWIDLIGEVPPYRGYLRKRINIGLLPDYRGIR